MKIDGYSIRISEEFSQTPFGRYATDGVESGEVFRDKILIPALNSQEHVTLVLDGVEGLPSSFWEEVMGGTVRLGWSLEQLESRLTLVTSDPELEIYVRLGWRYAKEESKKKHT